MGQSFTITYNGSEYKINNFPDDQVRGWDNNIKIKFYHRGKYSSPKITNSGGIKLPRYETQIYINGKYFIQLRFTTTPENESNITYIIKFLYCYGCDLDEIKRILKWVFYKN